MSFRDEAEDGRDLRKPFLHTGSWYRMGSRQSSIMSSSAQVLRDGSVSVVLCVLIVALGPVQFGFTVTPSLPSLFNFVRNYVIIIIIFLLFDECIGLLFFLCLFFFWWFQCGYSSPTQSEIINDLKLSISEVRLLSFIVVLNCVFKISFFLLSIFFFLGNNLANSLLMGTVLFVWLFIECGCHGWSSSEWSDCRIYWPERGMFGFA